MIGSGVEFKNTKKRGLERKTGPKRHRFGLFFFFLKGTGSKTTSFWPVPFKIKRAKMTSFWT